MPENLGAFFTFIGSATFIGFALAWIMGNSTWFEKQNTNIKMMFLVVVVLLLGFVSQALVTYVPAGVVADLQPWYQRGVASIAILLASQGWHELIHKNGTPAAAALAPTTGGNG